MSTQSNKTVTLPKKQININAHTRNAWIPYKVSKRGNYDQQPEQEPEHEQKAAQQNNRKPQRQRKQGWVSWPKF